MPTSIFGELLGDLAVWGPPLGAAIGGLLVGVLVRATVLRWIARAAAKSSWRYDDVFIDAIKGPIVIWFGLLGLRLAIRLLPLEAGAERTVATTILVIGIVSVTWAVARFAGGALRAAAFSGHLPGISLFASTVRLGVMLLGFMIVLQTLGIAIAPIITALGIGGLAVGLALQDTLANFFAGIRILASRNIRRGDYVRLDSGQEGFIEDILWSQTTIREPANSLVIVPNAKLAQAITTNYSLPTLPQNFVVNLDVAYGSDLEKVEKVALEVALETLHTVPEAEADFVPTVRFTEMRDSSIRFFVVFRTKAYTERWSLVSDFLKRAHRRFADEGIEIPFPQRVVQLKEPTTGR